MKSILNENEIQKLLENFQSSGSCSDYRYRSFYFGLRPYFQHISEISEKDVKNYENEPQKSENKKENEKFIKFYMAELLCYRY